MNKLVLLCIGLLSHSLFLSAQQKEEEKSGFDPSKIIVDGNVGVNTSNGFLNVTLSPQISYPLLPKLYVGLGPNLSYVQDLATTNSTFNYGGNVFSRFFITPEIYAQAESELLNYESGFDSNGLPSRSWSNSILLGAGYNKNIGNSVNASFTFLYIVNYNSDTSPYRSPIVLRGGINKSF